jgi:hypothetical protein
MSPAAEATGAARVRVVTATILAKEVNDLEFPLKRICKLLRRVIRTRGFP